MNSYKGEHVYPDDVIDKFRSIADDEALKRHRVELAKFVAKSFAAAGDELKVLGTIGQDDKPISSMGGSDETVTVSILLRIANQLVSAGADLFSDVAIMGCSSYSTGGGDRIPCLCSGSARSGW